MLQSVAVPAGCGKTHLAVALATRAVEAGYRGYFTTADDMVRHLCRAQTDGTFATKFRTYTAPTVLVIDLCRPRDYPDSVAFG
jgi:DNA replication protein DnaC